MGSNFEINAMCFVYVCVCVCEIFGNSYKNFEIITKTFRSLHNIIAKSKITRYAVRGWDAAGKIVLQKYCVYACYRWMMD